MPKLPDATALPRNTPRATVVTTPGRIARPIKQAANMQSAFASRTGGSFHVGAQLTANVAEQMAAADKRIQDRNDTIERAQLKSEFVRRASEIYAASDFTKRNAGKTFSDDMTALSAELGGQHAEGTADSQRVLAEGFASSTDGWVKQFAGAELKAKDEMLKVQMGETLNPLIADVSIGGDFAQAWTQFNTEMTGFDAAGKVAGVATFTLAGQEKLIETKADYLLRQHDPDSAEWFINTPFAQQYLSTGKRIQINAKIADARKPGKPYVYEDENGQLRYGTAEDVLSGTARGGAKAPPRRPLVVNEAQETAFRKNWGKQDADLGISLRNDGLKAVNDKIEITRMKLALESGGFTPGVFSNARYFLAQLAEFLGAGPELKELIGDATTADTLEVASRRLAIEEAAKLDRLTNMGLKFIEESLPALSRTTGGNMILLEVMDRIADRKQEIGALAEEYSQYSGLSPAGIPSLFERVKELEENDPVLTEELKEKIRTSVSKSPKNWRDVFPDLPNKGALPEGVVLPEGYMYGGIKKGQHFVITPSGKKKLIDLDKFRTK